MHPCSSSWWQFVKKSRPGVVFEVARDGSLNKSKDWLTDGRKYSKKCFGMLSSNSSRRGAFNAR